MQAKIHERDTGSEQELKKQNKIGEVAIGVLNIKLHNFKMHKGNGIIFLSDSHKNI